MDYKKSKAPVNTVTRNIMDLCDETGNIYEISRYYEKLPKPTLLATEEFVEGNIYWRDPSKDAAQTQE